jgi:hypothetical protein
MGSTRVGDFYKIARRRIANGPASANGHCKTKGCGAQIVLALLVLSSIATEKKQYFSI